MILWDRYRVRPTKRNHPAHLRISSIMSRLSRDRYLLPEEVAEIGRKIAYKISGNPSNSLNSAYHDCCEHVGMIRGKPPILPFDPGYKELLTALNKRKNDDLPEAILLSVFINLKLENENDC